MIAAPFLAGLGVGRWWQKARRVLPILLAAEVALGLFYRWTEVTRPAYRRHRVDLLTPPCPCPPQTPDVAGGPPDALRAAS